MTELSGPAAIIVQASKDAVRIAEMLTDPIDRARSLEEAAANIPLLQRQLRLARAAAIREAIASRSATSVAAELGVSRSRLYKILEGTDQ